MNKLLNQNCPVTKKILELLKKKEQRPKRNVCVWDLEKEG